MESRKKGLAITAITALAAMSSVTKPEYVVGGIVLIALVGIVVQTLLDKEKPNGKENLIDTGDNLPG